MELALDRKDGVDVLFGADLGLQLTGHDPLRPLYVVGTIGASISMGLLELLPTITTLILLTMLYLFELHSTITAVVNLLW